MNLSQSRGHNVTLAQNTATHTVRKLPRTPASNLNKYSYRNGVTWLNVEMHSPPCSMTSCNKELGGDGAVIVVGVALWIMICMFYEKAPIQKFLLKWLCRVCCVAVSFFC
ncbi:hypothetical protein DINM_003745 [Dirofilaria immitis]|nr:hypothetical protein [Dirofilaria immitis]